MLSLVSVSCSLTRIDERVCRAYFLHRHDKLKETVSSRDNVMILKHLFPMTKDVMDVMSKMMEIFSIELLTHLHFNKFLAIKMYKYQSIIVAMGLSFANAFCAPHKVSLCCKVGFMLRQMTSVSSLFLTTCSLHKTIEIIHEVPPVWLKGIF